MTPAAPRVACASGESAWARQSANACQPGGSLRGEDQAFYRSYQSRPTESTEDAWGLDAPQGPREVRIPAVVGSHSWIPS